jgi:hypothetical protein
MDILSFVNSKDIRNYLGQCTRYHEEAIKKIKIM